jgi:hypothetical protein
MPAKEGETSEYCSNCLFELSKGQPCSCEVICVPGIDAQIDPESGESFDIGEKPPLKGENNLNWKWLKENVSWYYTDKKDRPFPCCEYHLTDYSSRCIEENSELRILGRIEGKVWIK